VRTRGGAAVGCPAAGLELEELVDTGEAAAATDVGVVVRVDA